MAWWGTVLHVSSVFMYMYMYTLSKSWKRWNNIEELKGVCLPWGVPAVWPVETLTDTVRYPGLQSWWLQRTLSPSVGIGTRPDTPPLSDRGRWPILAAMFEEQCILGCTCSVAYELPIGRRSAHLLWFSPQALLFDREVRWSLLQCVRGIVAPLLLPWVLLKPSRGWHLVEFQVSRLHVHAQHLVAVPSGQVTRCEHYRSDQPVCMYMYIPACVTLNCIR